MKTSQETDKIFPALHNVQQEVGNIARSSTADTGAYKYSYADLTTIWAELKPIFKKHDLTLIQSPTTGANNVMGDYLETTIFHSSGQYISDMMRLVLNRDDSQGMGAAISYARRYQLSSMLGLVTEDDNDAKATALASGTQKAEWVRAYNIVAKKQHPDATPTYGDFIKFVSEVYGKHPSKIWAREHNQVLETIKAFEDKDE